MEEGDGQYIEMVMNKRLEIEHILTLLLRIWD
jgi:hypothetical protein